MFFHNNLTLKIYDNNYSQIYFLKHQKIYSFFPDFNIQNFLKSFFVKFKKFKYPPPFPRRTLKSTRKLRPHSIGVVVLEMSCPQ